ncbi:MAG: hypothetical protein HY055_07670 [Magnetospirillum sp.]|nr:hypothetical protein [Magnetospirillum sp.]
MMKSFLIGTALVIAAMVPLAADAQGLPGSAQGTDMSGAASRASSDAASKAAEQAVNDARKDKARTQAEAEQKVQTDAKKVTEQPK